MVGSTPRPHFTPEKDPVPILQEAGWDPGPVWTGGKSRPNRDSIPDRPVRSQSLYRLSYRAHSIYRVQVKSTYTYHSPTYFHPEQDIVDYYQRLGKTCYLNLQRPGGTFLPESFFFILAQQPQSGPGPPHSRGF